MGDGRYYTTLQFFNTLILLVLIMVITVNLVTVIYKVIHEKNSRWMIALYVVLWATIILRLIEEVIVGADYVALYSRIGKGLIILLTIGIAWSIGTMIRSIYLENKLITNGFNPDELLLVAGFFSLGLVIYLILLLLPLRWAEFYQFFFYGVLGYTLNRLLALVTPYGISLSLFTHTKDMILDYVFITDADGNIIFQNNNSETASYFKASKTLNLNNITSMFKHEVEHQQLRGKDYIKVDGGEKTLYFSYSIKPLTRHSRCVGTIITFTDVSGLMALLEDLDQKNGVQESINEELKEYATIVYHLEKEKEIQQLLTSIAENQEKSMLALKVDILNAIDLEDRQGYLENLEDMILRAKKNLRDVRHSVNTFKAYFGGKND